MGMKAPARDGTEIFDAEGKAKIGTVSPMVVRGHPGGIPGFAMCIWILGYNGSGCCR